MDITSLLLGPKSENNETFRKFFDLIIEDVLNFRNNYHPDELPIITERHKLNESFVSSRADFMQGLKEVLSKLRAHSIPTWDTSYIAHMHGDLLYPAVAGYISTIMYNPNNVTGESSPVTTQWEMDFIGGLCKMVGYPEFSAAEPKNSSDKGNSWGHITSGGTVANIEGLWIARNLKYWPLCLKLAIDSDNSKFGFLNDYEFEYFNKAKVKFGSLNYSQLFNLSPDLVYKISKALNEMFESKYPGVGSLSNVIKEYSLQNLGIYGIHSRIEKEINQPFPLPVVYISETKHYSWEKCMEVLGLGIENLKKVSADQSYKLDLGHLKKQIIESETPVLAVIPIIGTTEEGIIDPLHDLLKLREETEIIQGKSFYIHADAAYGGYFASMFSSSDFRNLTSAKQCSDELRCNFATKKEGKNFSEEGFVFMNSELEKFEESVSSFIKDILSLSMADSVTIDPHKLGYVPYPAGSVLFKNYKAKELITFEAPYLEWSGDKLLGVDRIFLGQTTLEGSRPGATAAACYLASKIVPLNIQGYGKMMAYTMLAAQKFFKTIPEYEIGKMKIIPQFTPSTNIVCYCIAYPGVIENPKYLNFLTNRVFDRMTKKLANRTTTYDYFISKTKINVANYKKHIFGLLKLAEIPKNQLFSIETSENWDFNILRSVLMNPLAPGLPESYYRGFWEKVEIIVQESLEEILDDIIQTKFQNKRVKVLWVENRDSVERLKDVIETTGLGRFFSFKFIFDKVELDQLNTRAKTGEMNITEDSSIIILDLCLDGLHGKNVDINKVFPVIEKCIEEGKQVICYSRYLSKNNDDSGNILGGIQNQIKLNDLSDKLSQLHFVGKDTDFEDFEKREFKDFESCKEVKSDMNNLMKKLILALQRI